MGHRHISTDVLIIGAGVIGAATAYELSKRNIRVAVVDAGHDVGNGCSYANAGLLAPEHVEPLTTPANLKMGLKYVFKRDSPFHISPSPRMAPWLMRFALASTPRRASELTPVMRSLARESVGMHRQYADDGLATGFRATGSLDVFWTKRRFDQAREAAHAGHGTVVLTAEDAKSLEPGLGEIAGAIQHVEDVMCESQAFVRATLKAAVKLGAEVHWGTDVFRLTGDKQGITGAETSAGRVIAKHVVVAAGLSSDRLVRDYGIRLPLLGGKGYVVDVPVQGSPLMPLTFKEFKVVATPYTDRLRFCGTMDLGDMSPKIVKSRVTAIRRAAAAGLPKIRTDRTVQVWTGQRPCTVDGIPVIGPSSKVDGLHIGAGHGMWGVVLAPITATAIANGVEGTNVRPDMTAFLPTRFE